MESSFLPSTLFDWFVARAQSCLQHRAELSPLHYCGQNPNSCLWLRCGSWKTTSLHQSLAEQSSGKELTPSSPSSPQIREFLRFSCFLPVSPRPGPSCCFVCCWYLLCLFSISPDCVSAFSARLRILVKSRKAPPSASLGSTRSDRWQEQ